MQFFNIVPLLSNFLSAPFKILSCFETTSFFSHYVVLLHGNGRIQ